MDTDYPNSIFKTGSESVFGKPVSLWESRAGAQISAALGNRSEPPHVGCYSIWAFLEHPLSGEAPGGMEDGWRKFGEAGSLSSAPVCSRLLTSAPVF